MLSGTRSITSSGSRFNVLKNMKRQVFFSFQYKPDNWRASMVRNMGKVDNSSTFSDNDWDTNLLLVPLRGFSTEKGLKILNSAKF